jgi:hypothetical protein
MGEVVPLPGVFRPDLETPTEPSQVLTKALELSLRDVAYVARTTEGVLIIGASHTDMDAAIGLLTRGIQTLAVSEQCHLPADETSE